MHHINGMAGSWTDWDLSQHGILEAENIAKVLTNELDSTNDQIHSSDLKRALQTAEPLAGIHLNRRMFRLFFSDQDALKPRKRLPVRLVDYR